MRSNFYLSKSTGTVVHSIIHRLQRSVFLLYLVLLTVVVGSTVCYLLKNSGY